MDKRYQVFVSSTYVDLKRERWEVMQALLELDCIPSGMELFPAADDDQWTFIQRVIDDCDYYVLLLGGRYGSVSPTTGKSYTQMEYEYAIAKGKPVIAFIHENPSALPVNLSESTDEGRKQLREFRELVQTRLCRKWANLDQLGAVVSRSITQLIKQKPAVGWVRADRVADESAAQEIVRLRRMIEELEEENKKHQSGLAELSAEEIAHGKEELRMRFEYEEFENEQFESEEEDDIFSDKHWKLKTISISMSWDEIIKTLAVDLTQQLPEHRVREIANELVYRRKPNWRYKVGIRNVFMFEDYFQIIKAQVRALDLVEVTGEEDPYPTQHWKLNPKGDAYAVRVRVMRSRMS